MPEQDVVNARDDAPVSSNGVAGADRSAHGPSTDGPVVGGGGSAADLVRSLREVRGRVESALSQFAATGDALRRAADVMGGKGVLPGYQLVHALGECHRQFLRMRQEVFRHAQARGRSLPPVEQVDGLAVLVRLIDDLTSDAVPKPTAAAEPAEPEPIVAASNTAPGVETEPVFNGGATEGLEPAVEPLGEPPTPGEIPPVPGGEPERAARESGDDVRRAALAVLDKALGMTPRDGTELPSLAECLERIRALRATIADAPADGLPDEARQLVDGGHPVAGLLAVIEGVEGLSDAQWAALHTSVSESFGRTLAVAAARGRIALKG